MHRPIIIPPPSSVTQAWIQSFPVIKLTSSRPSGVSHFWFQVEWLGRLLVSHFSFCHFLFRKMRQRESIKVAYFFYFFCVVFSVAKSSHSVSVFGRVTLLAIPCGNLWNSVCWPSERLQYVGTAGISLPCSAFGVPPMGSCFSRFYICRLFLD